MYSSVVNARLPSSRNFDLIKDSFLQSAELPLAEVLDDNIFDAHEIDFRSDEDVAELRRQRSDATNLELHHDTVKLPLKLGPPH